MSHDSDSELEDIVERAVAAGLDGIVITDHQSVEGALQLAAMAPEGLEVVIGCEYDTDDGSQVIGLDVDHVIAETRLLPLLDSIKAAGGLTLLPHPFRRGGGVFAAQRERSPAFIADVLALADLVESFNGRDHPDHNEASHRLVTERGLAGVAGSDAHRIAEIGSVFVDYAADDRDHGRSPRGIHYPDQRPRSEHRLRRGIMRTYHRLEPRLPHVVGRGYRRLRRGLELDRSRGGTPRLQYQLARRAPLTPDET